MSASSACHALHKPLVTFPLQFYRSIYRKSYISKHSEAISLTLLFLCDHKWFNYFGHASIMLWYIRVRSFSAFVFTAIWVTRHNKNGSSSSKLKGKHLCMSLCFFRWLYFWDVCLCAKVIRYPPFQCTMHWLFKLNLIEMWRSTLQRQVKESNTLLHYGVYGRKKTCGIHGGASHVELKVHVYKYTVNCRKSLP